MSGYKLVVLTSPVTGKEDAYNDWYTNQHLADVLKVPGFSAAQRFKLLNNMAGEIKQPYLAIYEMDVDGPEAASRAADALSTTEMYISDALDLQSVGCGVFEPCGERRTPGADTGPYRLLAFTQAVEGREKEFNDWYDQTHLREVMAPGGFASAERFRLQRTVGGQFENPSLVLYSLEARDGASLQTTLRGMGATKYTMSDAGRFDRTQLALYESCSPRVTAAN